MKGLNTPASSLKATVKKSHPYPGEDAGNGWLENE
jgi:hypothetical protein